MLHEKENTFYRSGEMDKQETYLASIDHTLKLILKELQKGKEPTKVVTKDDAIQRKPPDEIKHKRTK